MKKKLLKMLVLAGCIMTISGCGKNDGDSASNNSNGAVVETEQKSDSTEDKDTNSDDANASDEKSEVEVGEISLPNPDMPAFDVLRASSLEYDENAADVIDIYYGAELIGSYNYTDDGEMISFTADKDYNVLHFNKEQDICEIFCEEITGNGITYIGTYVVNGSHAVLSIYGTGLTVSTDICNVQITDGDNVGMYELDFSKGGNVKIIPQDGGDVTEALFCYNGDILYLFDVENNKYSLCTTADTEKYYDIVVVGVGSIF